MNNVSMLFYLADVLDNAKVPLGFIAVLTFILIPGLIFMGFAGETKEVKAYFKRLPNYEREEVTFSEWEKLGYGAQATNNESIFVRFFPGITRWLFLVVPLWLMLVFAGIMLPSKSTIYIIATSEFVEDVSKTDIGTDAGALMGDTLKYLRTELDKLRTPSQ